MKHFVTLLSFLPLAAFAQVTVDVEAGGSNGPGSTVDPYYEPMNITIEAGDAVHWVGVSGSHNVYGGLDDFPENPEGFSSGDPTQDLDYTRIFNVPGLYNYHCTQQGHSETQHGSILVLAGGQNVEEVEGLGVFTMFPVPAEGDLTVELQGSGLARVDVLGVDGRLFRSVPVSNTQRTVVDLDGLATGRYLLRLIDNKGQSLARPFIKG